MSAGKFMLVDLQGAYLYDPEIATLELQSGVNQ